MQITIELSEFNPQRLKEARMYHGLDIEELSKISNLSAGVLIDLENGINKPNVNQLAQLYWSLEFPMQFFCEKDNFVIRKTPTFYCDMKSGHQARKDCQMKLF